jgi:hypothetical protein
MSFTIISVLGTQEIIILLSAGIPLFLIIWFARMLKRKQLSSTAGINPANEIEKLFSLKEKGAITQQEFDDRKSKLLK